MSNGDGGWWKVVVWCVLLEVVAAAGVAFAKRERGGGGVWGPKNQNQAQGLGFGPASAQRVLERGCLYGYNNPFRSKIRGGGAGFGGELVWWKGGDYTHLVPHPPSNSPLIPTLPSFPCPQPP